jgi:hypothetical protein
LDFVGDGLAGGDVDATMMSIMLGGRDGRGGKQVGEASAQIDNFHGDD